MSSLGYYLLQKRIHVNSPSPNHSKAARDSQDWWSPRLIKNSLLRRVSLLYNSMDPHNTKVCKKYSFYIHVHLTNITTFITFYIGYLQLHNWNKPCIWGIYIYIFANILWLKYIVHLMLFSLLKFHTFAVAIFEFCAQKPVCLLFCG